MNCERNKAIEGNINSRQNVKNNSEIESKPPHLILGNSDYPGIEENYEETMTKPILPSKMKISFDEEETKRIGWEKGFSTSRKVQLKKNENLKINNIQEKNLNFEPDHLSFKISANPKVEEILNKKPLRERFSGLLPLELELPISFDHQQILKRMDLIDINIDFLGTSRNSKILFFDTVQKSIYKNTSIVVELKHIQQLLFLDENCYMVEWKMNDKIKKFDLKISLPKINSAELRRLEMRKKMVKFLIRKEEEFLKQNNLEKSQQNNWHELFEYKRTQIPEKFLPAHPNSIMNYMKIIPDRQGEKTDNNFKHLFQAKKNDSDARSMNSASVADMIFSKVSASEISNQILEMIKEKEKKNEEMKQKKDEESNKIDKSAVLKIYEEILLVYMSKNVSNIFKTTLVELIQQRLQFKDELILKYIDLLLETQELKVFKVVESSKKIKVVQIDKQKFKEGKTFLEQKNFD